MGVVYIVVENGDPYPIAYSSFASAAAAAKEKYREVIEEQQAEQGDGPICSDLDVPEDTVKNITYLYVEKGIHIYIYKMPIL
jgi:hypothetical protein